MQFWQDKTRDADIHTEATPSVHKATTNAMEVTRVPEWANTGAEAVPAGLQAKLTINQRGDVYEQEADRVAEQVMRMPIGGTAEKREEMPVMHKESSGAQASRDAPPIVQQALNNGGHPLDVGIQETMATRFGQNFSDVRVHTDEQAAESAQAIQARAYTVGNDLVFGEGHYQPGTGEGQRLLAHELTHVMQQGATNHQTSSYGRVQRFEAPEHIDIGNAGEPIQIKLANGLELTYSEVSALIGDFYETTEMLDKADPTEVKRILQLVKQQRQPGGKVESRDVEFQQATQAREKTVYDPITGKEKGKQGKLEPDSFFSLAKKNALHFAPENLRTGWRQGHKEAVENYARRFVEAQKQGKNDEAAELRRLALLTDAGAAHFLEDAFSSGHILNPDDVKKWMTKQWTTNPDFKERVIKRLKEAAYKDKWYAPDATIDKSIDAVLRSVSVDDVSSAGLKVIHDYLNRTGIEVINGRGDHWKAFGDYNLWKSSDTLKFAGEAVALSKRQVLDALSGKSINIDDVSKIVPEKVLITGQANSVPIGTEATQKLLVVLESLLLSSDDLWKLLKVANETQEKAITPFDTAEISAAALAEKKQRETMERGGVKLGDIASKMIKARIGFLGSLDGPKLSSDLLSEPDELVETVLDRLDTEEYTDIRQTVSYEYMKRIPIDNGESQLCKRGVHLLLRLQAELLSGSTVTSVEKTQANRIAALLKRVPGEKARAAGEFTKHQAEVAIATVTGSAKKAVEEVGALKPERILDVVQAEAAALIEKHRGVFGLAEGKLAADLKGKSAKVIIEVIDQLQPEDNDDDVSLEYMKRIPARPGEAELHNEKDEVLRRLRRALLSGHSSDDEKTQARRIDSVLGGI